MMRMNKPTSPTSAADTPPTQDQIARRAREIWHARGHPLGQDLDIWLEAEREMRRPPPNAGRPTASRQDAPTFESRPQGTIKRRRSSKKTASEKADETLRGGDATGAGNPPTDPISLG